MSTRNNSILLIALLLAACGTKSIPSADGNSAQRGGAGTPTLGTTTTGHGATPERIDPKLPYATDPASIERQKLPSTLTVPNRPELKGGFSSLALGGLPNVVALRVLVVTDGLGSTTNPNSQLEMAKAVLNQQAIPFDVLDATTTDLTEAALVAADGSGRYQGVVLTTGGLGYQDPVTGWTSALSTQEWTLLWNYEKTYSVRQLALYTYPGSSPEDYGIRPAGTESATNTAQVTTAGQQVFGDLKPGKSMPITYAWNYPAATVAVAGLTTTPLLTDATGAVLAVQSNTSDGRERLALTMAHNPYLLHSQLFSYGLLNWLTKGVYLGEFRRYLQVDVDDWFIDDDLWKPTSTSTGIVQGTFRISASDALGVRTQQTALRRTYPVASAFKFAVAFNASGANTAAPDTCAPTASSVDPLTSVSRCMYNTFNWVNHSLDHLSMDFADYTTAYDQFQGNQDRADTLGLNYSPSAAVSGEHSGLGWYNAQGLDYNKTDYGLNASNANFLQGAADASITYLASNRGVASHWDASCPNCGVVHPMKTSLFLVPRWPTNIFYYASTPDEVTSSYNAIYGPAGTAHFWDHNLTYQEILDKETEIAMNHVLSGSMFPHYMHQTNFRQFVSGRSLVYDWTSSVLDRYSSYSTLPIRTLLWKDLGAYLKLRTAFVKAEAGISGSWDRAANTITLRSPGAVTAFVTGTRSGTSETYGSTVISRVTLAANTPTTIPIVK
ncbi:hypothetical protein [Deinococcus sp.]|uniref:Agd3-related carbohydrate-binding protein n=1 Tax=Deinococcus sp. TaxID=47478 RepID=UPI002869AB6C|nr:hypothetical protein [Deinococcus sp.]